MGFIQRRFYDGNTAIHSLRKCTKIGEIFHTLLFHTLLFQGDMDVCACCRHCQRKRIKEMALTPQRVSLFHFEQRAKYQSQGLSDLKRSCRQFSRVAYSSGVSDSAVAIGTTKGNETFLSSTFNKPSQHSRSTCAPAKLCSSFLLPQNMCTFCQLFVHF